MRSYPEEIKNFIADNVDGMYVTDLVKNLNDTFGTNYTYSQIKSYKKNHNLKSNVPKSRKRGCKLFTSEMEEFIAKNINGITTQQMSEMLNNKFSTEYTPRQIATYKKNYKLQSGLNTQFKKGEEPYNKGQKGVYPKGCEKSWFKKGHVPINHKPIGSERITKDGYIVVKIEEPKKWKLKHRVVWEQHHGKVPRNHVVIFLDGDRTNTSIENLDLINRNELRIMNKHGLKSEDAALTETGVLIARLMSTVNKKKK